LGIEKIIKILTHYTQNSVYKSKITNIVTVQKFEVMADKFYID
jgi:hypothetical protein